MNGSPYFAAAFALVVGQEGAYVDDPADPGGPTKYGISQRAYPSVDIFDLTLEEAHEIYLRDYWGPAGCDSLPWEWAVCLFDCAVNQGLGAAKELHAESNSVANFMARRAVRYAGSSEFSRFGLGWEERLFTIHKAAQVTPT